MHESTEIQIRKDVQNYFGDNYIIENNSKVYFIDDLSSFVSFIYYKYIRKNGKKE